MDNIKPANRNASERTPLLNGGGESSHVSADGAGVGSHHHHRANRSNLFHFFVNSRYTPGTDHSSIVVRSAAYTWHVTKVTLLSSALPLRLAEQERKKNENVMLMKNTHRLCQLSPRHCPRGHRRRHAQLERHCRLYPQLLRHHPPRRRAVLCD